jgi:hypothetical protein
MSNAAAMIDAIDAHLAADEAQLRRIVEQTEAVRSAFDDLMARLRREIEASGHSPEMHRLRG